MTIASDPTQTLDQRNYVPAPTEAAREADTGMLGTHSLLQQIIDRLSDLGTRSEKPAPSYLDLSSAVGRWNVHTKFRTNLLIISAPVGDTMNLSIGTATKFRFLGANVPIIVPIEITIERGVDIQVKDETTPATTFYAYIQGYPE